MAGRRERERKAARGRAFGWGGPGVGWVDMGESGAGYSTYNVHIGGEADEQAAGHDMLRSGYSPFTGEWFRDPPADRPFATDVDGTIILHPSQWKVLA